jgi:DNA-binding transcriptional ArsR family regulator
MARPPYQHPGIEELTVAGVLHALSDPVRLSIVQSLSPGQEAVSSALEVNVAPSTLSHHMAVLRKAGVIASRRAGMRCLISLRPDLSERFPGLLEIVLHLVRESART